jgi:hypothetical protein
MGTSISDELVFDCPYCGDTKGHLYVNLVKNAFYCFKCDKGGGVSHLIADNPRLAPFIPTRPTRVRFDSGGVTLEIRRFEYPISILDKDPMARVALSYLKTRGMNRREILDSQAFVSRGLPYYIIFPDVLGGASSFWIARNTRRGRIRWLFPRNGETQLRKSESVWGFHQVNKGEVLWLAEGIFDAIAVRGLALFGKKASQAQLRKVFSLAPKGIVIAFDQDARAEAEALQVELRGIVPTQIRLPKSQKDYGELLARGWRRSRVK